MAEFAPNVPGFWEIGAYKTNVHRIRDGIDQIDELSKMVKERADIESKYAKLLQAYSEKWRTHVDRNVNEGALRSAWMDIVDEADGTATVHGRVEERLLDEVAKTLALFRKENHHPSAFRSPKEIREIEEAFEKAQKQWKKLHEKVENAKRNYYSSCRAERSCQIAVMNAQADTSVSPDALSKVKERHQKAKDEVEKTRKHYQAQLQEIASYRAPYIENMTFVFEKCQLGELKRAKFVMEMMGGIHTVLADLIRNAKFNELHIKVERKLKATDESTLQKDLKKWSSLYGVDAVTAWPTYEEYSPEMRQIANARPNPKEAGGVVLTRQIIKNDETPIAGPATPTRKQSPQLNNNNNNVSGKRKIVSKDSDSDTNTYDSRKTEPKRYENMKAAHTWDERDILPITTPDSAKYADDFDDDDSAHSANSYKPREGIVLYNYIPVDDDEIALKEGERIELLSDKDELGWRHGRIGDRYGLFPADYVRVDGE